MFVRAYLRASTSEQDANRAKDQLKAFVAERGLKIAACYVENESGAKLARPELFRLLADAHPGDILLVEQVDRLSRLTAEDWERLKSELTARRVRVVALDLPTSWMMATKAVDEFTGPCSRRSTGCYSICSRRLLAKITSIAAAGRHRAKPRRRQKVAIRGVQKMPSATTGSLACSPLVSLGDQSRARPAAAALQSRRLRSA
jgi:DNA invertase Pin-like site-specific DNA recombinase